MKFELFEMAKKGLRTFSRTMVDRQMMTTRTMRMRTTRKRIRLAATVTRRKRETAKDLLSIDYNSGKHIL